MTHATTHPHARTRTALVGLAVATLAALAALLAPAPADANKRLRVGFLDNAYASAYPDLFWSEARDLNIGFMRWDGQWPHIAPTRPRNPRDPGDPAYDWAQTDAFMRRAAQEGMSENVMMTLWGTPSWASSIRTKRGGTARMPRLRDWRNFVYAAAKRYSGTYTPAGATEPLPRVKAWEAWNEPNGYFALQPQRVRGRLVSPRNYVALLNSLGTEVRRAVPFRPTIVGGALYKTGGGNSTNPVAFMRGMRAAKARFDVLSVHPYNRTPRLLARDGRTQSRTNPKFIAVGNLGDFVTLSNQIFGRKRPIWVTEFGINSRTAGKRTKTVTEAQQAIFARDSIRIMRRLPQVERMSWFLLRDDNPKPAGKWYTTGLRRLNDSAKPAYGAWKRAAVGLGGIERAAKRYKKKGRR